MKKPKELPRELWPACRRIMLRRLAQIAHDMLTYADEKELDVDRSTLEELEREAVGELTADNDTMEQSRADDGLMPPDVDLSPRTGMGTFLDIVRAMPSEAAITPTNWSVLAMSVAAEWFRIPPRDPKPWH